MWQITKQEHVVKFNKLKHQFRSNQQRKLSRKIVKFARFFNFFQYMNLNLEHIEFCDIVPF